MCIYHNATVSISQYKPLIVSGNICPSISQYHTLTQHRMSPPEDRNENSALAQVSVPPGCSFSTFASILLAYRDTRDFCGPGMLKIFLQSGSNPLLKLRKILSNSLQLARRLL